MTLNRQNLITKLLVHSNLLALFALSLAPFVTGCGTTAIITKKAGSPIEGKITSSDSGTVYVQKSEGGFDAAVDRDDIADIDHPGNVAATIGTVLAGYGVANIIVGAPDCDRRGAAYCTGVFLPAAIGGSLMAYGLAVWLRSVDAALPSSQRAASRLTVVPVASMDKKNEFYGVSARVSF